MPGGGRKLRWGRWSSPSPLIAAAVLMSAPVQAQNSADHLQHHPGAEQPAAQPASTPPPADPMSNGTAGMAGMMADMHGGSEHSGYQPPLFPRLIALGPEDAAGRTALQREAEHRMMLAGAAVRQASNALAGPMSPKARSETVDRLRTATSEFQSAAVVASALRTGSHSQPTGLNWFRSSMGLPGVEHAEARGLFGLSGLHLALMTMLGLLALGLVALQMRRIARARALLAPAAGLGPKETTALPLAAGPAAALPASADQPPVQSLPPAAQSGRARRWSGMLRVAHIASETPTVETYRLVPVDGTELPFDYLPGQFLQVEVEPEPGRSLRRSYTIASSPTQRAFVEITVKREERGSVSRYLNEKLAVGDLLKVSGPFGAFTFTGSDADSIVLIAGGVGITPVMSVLRYLTDKAWPGEIFFIYGARSTEEFVFREEIERLEQRHANLHVLAAMQRSPGTVWLGPEGQLTKELVAAAVPKIAERRIHLCGPPPMMAAVRNILLELGVPEAQIHTEAFGPASLPAENAPAAVTAATSQGPVRTPSAPAKSDEVAATTVTFSLSGVAAPLHRDETILEAAEGAGVEIPYSCRVGECGVCVTKLIQGEVSMAVETGLDPADKAQGYVLACQAKSTGGPLVVEA